MPGLPPFGFFSFAIAGVPLIAGTIAIVVFFGQKLLPKRSGRSIPSDLSQHARTLVEQYRLDDGLFQLRVRATLPYFGSAPAQTRRSDGLSGPDPGRLQAGDGSGRLARPRSRKATCWSCAATPTSAGAWRRHASGVPDGGAPDGRHGALFNRNSGLAEVVIPPRSDLIGQSVFPGHGHAERRSGDPGGAAAAARIRAGRDDAGRR